MAFTNPTTHKDTPKPADKEGGVWMWKIVYGREFIKVGDRWGIGRRTSSKEWFFVKSGGELKF
jgi:hypothetical protein